MRSMPVLLALLFFITIMVPYRSGAQDPGSAFRERVSSSRDEVGSSDITEEVRFGREVAARVIGRYGLTENPQFMKYVNLVGKTLAMSTNRPEIDFKFAILNTDEINAYAAPGGYIFITRGALMKMHDEAELAGVLAHEIGHVVEKHVVRELNIKSTDKSAVTGLALLIGGGSESARLAFSQAVDKALDVLFKDGYKREDETQADRDAVLFCALSGYDPSGLVRYFERISGVKGKQIEVLNRTHPSYENRITWLKGTMMQEGIEPASYKVFKDRFIEISKSMK